MSEAADWFDAVVQPLAEPAKETAPTRSRGRPRKAESGGGGNEGGGGERARRPAPRSPPIRNGRPAASGRRLSFD